MCIITIKYANSLYKICRMVGIFISTAESIRKLMAGEVISWNNIL